MLLWGMRASIALDALHMHGLVGVSLFERIRSLEGMLMRILHAQILMEDMVILVEEVEAVL